MSEIKPCPFCGSDDIGVLGGLGTAYVECADCGASGPYGDMTNQEAIDAWNTRATTPNVRERSDP